MGMATARIRKWWDRSLGVSVAIPLALLVIGSLLVPLALMGVWVQTVLLDTDRYVDAVTPLIGRASTQRAVADELAARLLEEFDLESRISKVQPDASPREVESLAEQVGYYTRLLSLQLVQSETFVPIWSAANRDLHASLANSIDGEGPVRLSPEGDLAIDLSSAAAQLTQRLRDANLPLPDGLLPLLPQGDVAIVDIDALLAVRPVLSALSFLYVVLPILAVLCLTMSVLWSTRRLLWIALVGAGMIITMLALEVGLRVGEARYTTAAEAGGVPAEISRAMWRPLVGSLDVAARTILIVGVGAVIFAGVAALWRARDQKPRGMIL